MVSSASAAIAASMPCPSRESRSPARRYISGVDTRNALASWDSTSALGLRNPRSIWLRYGLLTPACSASWRGDRLDAFRTALRPQLGPALQGPVVPAVRAGEECGMRAHGVGALPLGRPLGRRDQAQVRTGEPGERHRPDRRAAAVDADRRG